MALVTAIVLDPGTPATHITVTDQAGNPIPPANITWGAPPPGVTITPDETGFNFDAPPGTLNSPVVEVAATDASANGVTANLGVSVQLTVTALQFETP